jgi:hypothetical protein
MGHQFFTGFLTTPAKVLGLSPRAREIVSQGAREAARRVRIVPNGLPVERKKMVALPTPVAFVVLAYAQEGLD